MYYYPIPHIIVKAAFAGAFGSSWRLLEPAGASRTGPGLNSKSKVRYCRVRGVVFESAIKERSADLSGFESQDSPNSVNADVGKARSESKHHKKRPPEISWLSGVFGALLGAAATRRQRVIDGLLNQVFGQSVPVREHFADISFYSKDDAIARSVNGAQNPGARHKSAHDAPMPEGKNPIASMGGATAQRGKIPRVPAWQCESQERARNYYGTAFMP